jgi:hypothetical protein
LPLVVLVALMVLAVLAVLLSISPPVHDLLPP